MWKYVMHSAFHSFASHPPPLTITHPFGGPHIYIIKNTSTKPKMFSIVFKRNKINKANMKLA